MQTCVYSCLLALLQLNCTGTHWKHWSRLVFPTCYQFKIWKSGLIISVNKNQCFVSSREADAHVYVPGSEKLFTWCPPQKCGQKLFQGVNYQIRQIYIKSIWEQNDSFCGRKKNQWFFHKGPSSISHPLLNEFMENFCNIQKLKPFSTPTALMLQEQKAALQALKSDKSGVFQDRRSGLTALLRLISFLTLLERACMRLWESELRKTSQWLRLHLLQIPAASFHPSGHVAPAELCLTDKNGDLAQQFPACTSTNASEKPLGRLRGKESRGNAGKLQNASVTETLQSTWTFSISKAFLIW